MKRIIGALLVASALSGCEAYSYGDIHSMTEQCDKVDGRLVVTRKDNYQRPTMVFCEVDGFRYGFRFTGSANGYVLN